MCLAFRSWNRASCLRRNRISASRAARGVNISRRTVSNSYLTSGYRLNDSRRGQNFCGAHVMLLFASIVKLFMATPWINCSIQQHLLSARSFARSLRETPRPQRDRCLHRHALHKPGCSAFIASLRRGRVRLSKRPKSTH
jgi:hypothetical protein